MRIAVTGAFGYSGRYIAGRLLDAGHEVITLTNSPDRPDPFGGRVRAYPFHFDQPQALRESLRNVDALINNYWVRFDHRLFTHSRAVANTHRLFDAARDAGVRRIVHVSITNPDIRSDLPYFRGKAELEEALISLGIPYSILRPTVLFGKEDVLINNIAWSLRHLPVMGVFGDGNYRLQPVYVDDLAALAAEAVTSRQNEIVNAIGPETFAYRELVGTIARILGLRRLVVGVPPAMAYWACRVLGWFVQDMIVTREEIRGLMEGRLNVDTPPPCKTALTKWVEEHKESLGRSYTSELARRVNRRLGYRTD